MVDGTHPLGITLCQVVVNCDDVDALAGKGVEIGRKGSNQGLALTSLHLRDLAVVEDHTSHELDVEMSLANGTLGGLPHSGEGLRQQAFQCLSAGQTLLELLSLQTKLFVAELAEAGLQGVYLRHRRLQLLELSLV